MTIAVADVGTRFRERVFREAPLTALAVLSIAAAVGGAEWTTAAAPLPWIVSIGFVGLPHGAADLAASRTVCRGGTLVGVCALYLATMAAVAAAFVLAPAASIAAFVIVSCWHFGTAHLDADADVDGVARAVRPVAAVARGCVVLAMPLALWPEATAATAIDLAALAVGPDEAARSLPVAAVRAGGVILAALTLIALAAEAILSARAAGGSGGGRRTLTEVAAIGALGAAADPLFAVGSYFLLWHGWRQMAPLAETLGGPAPESWAGLVGALRRVHTAALPLLVPAWAVIVTLWWLSSPGLSGRGLAIVSIGAYLVVTPAHEWLGEALGGGRFGVRPWPAPPRAARC